MKFGGFTEGQMEVVARKMGFDGPMNKFNDFLSASPNNSALLSKYTTKAQKMLDGRTMKMAKGGAAIKQLDEETKKNEEKKKLEALKISTNQYPNNDAITKSLINDPSKLTTPAQTSTIDFNKNQQIDRLGSQAPTLDPVKAAQAGSAATAAQVTQPKAATVDTSTVGKEINAETDKLKAAQGTVSEGAQVKAATALPSANATVQGQLDKILTSFEDGQMPPWAAGAQRMVNAVMNSRGLGASSMQASASTQALMESALEIAVQDAATYSTFEQKNLDNRQQARLFNAQSFLQMDLANLANEQQTRLFKTQTRVQGMLSDQAAENASKQFNATSQNQTNQFFGQLKAQINQFNAVQQNGMKQFDVEQKNTVGMFNQQMTAQRDQFNAENRLIIDQANAKWRQTITTTNNAEANENNRLNAQLMTGMTTAAYNNLWQRERDIMSYAFTASENAANRSTQIVLQKMGGKSAQKVANAGNDVNLGQAAGAFIAKTVFNNVFGF